MRLALCLVALVLLAVAPTFGQEVSEARVREAIDDAARGLGQAVAGGSPLTGPAATLGGIGHLQIGVVGAITRIEVEDPRAEEGTVDFLLPVGTLQGAVGLWGGNPRGFGAIDVVGKVGPVVAREEYRDSEILYGLGARVGLLKETAIVPSVSATVARAWIHDLAWGDPADDEVSFSGDVTTLSARVDVSKTLLLVTPYAGVGIDRTRIDATYRIPPSQSTGGNEITGSFDTSSTHHKAYAGVELALLLWRATVEVGVYDGGTFGAIGVRLGM